MRGLNVTLLASVHVYSCLCVCVYILFIDIETQVNSKHNLQLMWEKGGTLRTCVGAQSLRVVEKLALPLGNVAPLFLHSAYWHPLLIIANSELFSGLPPE